MARSPRLRVRLFLMVILLAAPAFALLVFDNIDQRQKALDTLADDARRAARDAAMSEARIAERVETALRSAAVAPALRSEAQCDVFITDWMPRFPEFYAVGVVDADGNTLCSQGGIVHDTNLTQEKWFQDALRGRFIPGASVPDAPNGSAVVFAQPIPHGEQPQGVLYAAMRLAHLSAELAARHEESGATLILVDGEGNILAGAPDPQSDGVSAPDDDLIQRALDEGHGTFRRADSDEVVAVQPLGVEPGWHVIAIVDASKAAALISQDFAQRSLVLLVLAGGLLFGLGMVWNRMMVQPLRVLERGALSLKEGHMTSPVGTGQLPRELRSVADAFDAMADEVQRTRLQLERKVLERTVELRQRNDDLQRATRYKSEFLANMSHEIRTPLNAVIGMANVLADMDMGEEERRAVETIKLSGHHLLTVISDILDISRIEAGRMDLEEAPLAVRDMVEESIALVAPQARSKGLEIIVRIHDEVPVGMRGDAGRLRQILVNLVNNAVKFTDEGHVLVDVSRRNGRIRFTVADTGPGVPSDKVGELFTEFHQLEMSSERRFAGTGLGLAISHRLVELMDGDIGYDDAGEGGTFWFEVPLHPVEPPSHPPWEDAEVLQGKRVLLVDDHPTNLEVIGHDLRRWGLKVDARQHSRSALEEAISHASEYDALLLDVMMPGLDGPSFVRKLRQAVPDAPPILFLGSSHEVPDLQDPVLQKPVRSADFFRALCRVMGLPAQEGPRHAFDVDLAQKAPLRILVAEDSPVNQRVALAMLERFGYSADVASDGNEAVDMARRREYDLILMDVEMPGIDGREATRRILEGGSRAHICAMTAHVSPEDRRACAAAGMAGYLAKPVSVEGLAKELQGASRQLGRVKA